MNHDPDSPSWLATAGGILMPATSGDDNTPDEPPKVDEGGDRTAPPLADSVRWHRDINFLIRCTDRTNYRAEFEAFAVIGDYPDGSPMLEDANEPLRLRTSDPNTAEIFLSASVDWQGCCNVDFGDGGAHHFCTREELANVGVLLTRVYSWAAEIIPTWEG